MTNQFILKVYVYRQRLCKKKLSMTLFQGQNSYVSGPWGSTGQQITFTLY